LASSSDENKVVSPQKKQTYPQKSSLSSTEKSLLNDVEFLAFAQELARLVCMDMQLNLKKILVSAAALWQNGYRIPDLKATGKYWSLKDWRGKEGGIPHLANVAEIIQQAVLWQRNGGEGAFGLMESGYLDYHDLLPSYMEY
jgi:hypothetical protein